MMAFSCVRCGDLAKKPQAGQLAYLTDATVIVMTLADLSLQESEDFSHSCFSTCPKNAGNQKRIIPSLRAY